MTRVWANLVACLAVILALITFSCARVSQQQAAWQAALSKGELVVRQEWPQRFIDLFQEAERRNIEIDGVLVFYVEWAGYHYWISEGSPKLFDLMTERWELSRKSVGSPFVETFHEYMPVRIVSEDARDDAAYYSLSPRLIDETGHSIWVMPSQHNRVVVARYCYPF
jgi:hypothetical protein